MERQLFSWEGWDEYAVGYFQFYNCTLVQDIGTFKAGERFNNIHLDFEAGTLVLCKGDKTENFKLKLEVVPS